MDRGCASCVPVPSGRESLPLSPPSARPYLPRAPCRAGEIPLAVTERNDSLPDVCNAGRMRMAPSQRNLWHTYLSAGYAASISVASRGSVTHSSSEQVPSAPSLPMRLRRSSSRLSRASNSPGRRCRRSSYRATIAGKATVGSTPLGVTSSTPPISNTIARIGMSTPFTCRLTHRHSANGRPGAGGPSFDMRLCVHAHVRACVGDAHAIRRLARLAREVERGEHSRMHQRGRVPTSQRSRLLYSKGGPFIPQS